MRNTRDLRKRRCALCLVLLAFLLGACGNTTIDNSIYEPLTLEDTVAGTWILDRASFAGSFEISPDLFADTIVLELSGTDYELIAFEETVQVWGSIGTFISTTSLVNGSAKSSISIPEQGHGTLQLSPTLSWNPVTFWVSNTAPIDALELSVWGAPIDRINIQTPEFGYDLRRRIFSRPAALSGEWEYEEGPDSVVVTIAADGNYSYDDPSYFEAGPSWFASGNTQGYMRWYATQFGPPGATVQTTPNQATGWNLASIFYYELERNHLLRLRWYDEDGFSEEFVFRRSPVTIRLTLGPEYAGMISAGDPLFFDLLAPDTSDFPSSFYDSSTITTHGDWIGSWYDFHTNRVRVLDRDGQHIESFSGILHSLGTPLSEFPHVFEIPQVLREQTWRILVTTWDSRGGFNPPGSTGYAALFEVPFSEADTVDALPVTGTDNDLPGDPVVYYVEIE